MRALPVICLGALGLTACAPSHQFVIDTDEPIRGVEIALKNVRKSKVTISDPGRAHVDLWVGDSSGEIRVDLASGKRVACKIGYMTDGVRQPSFLIENGQCREGLWE